MQSFGVLLVVGCWVGRVVGGLIEFAGGVGEEGFGEVTSPEREIGVGAVAGGGEVGVGVGVGLGVGVGATGGGDGGSLGGGEKLYVEPVVPDSIFTPSPLDLATPELLSNVISAVPEGEMALKVIVETSTFPVTPGSPGLVVRAI